MARLHKFLCAIVVAAFSAISAEPTAPEAVDGAPRPALPAAPKTLEEQIRYLEGALSESLRMQDFAMLNMAVNGFKTAGLAGKDLELSLLRAERDAAWDNSPMAWGGARATSASLEAWGLMARAKLGIAEALQMLRTLADDHPAPPEPQPAQAGRVDFMARQKVNEAYALKVSKRGNALLALALLKDDGIKEKALAELKSKSTAADVQAMRFGGAWGGSTDPVILAVLESDQQAGLDRILEYCSDEKIAAKEQAGTLSDLHTLSVSNPWGGQDKFAITGEIRQRLPKDLQSKLIAPFISIVKRYTPDTKQGWDVTMNYINNLGNAFPANSIPAEGLDALEAMAAKVTGPNVQWAKQSLNAILKKNGRDQDKPVQPPAPTF